MCKPTPNLCCLPACHLLGIRTNPDFQKLLAVALWGLLAGCDDPDSDVRMSADECLNRIITCLIEDYLGRLQVELYKAIKKDDTPERSLRAALSKFADLAHKVKPIKRRVFVTSLLPSLGRIMKMPGEPIQETLASCMDKLCTALGLFFTDTETHSLLSSFVNNMKSSSVVIRRTATDCAISICEGSNSPYHYLTVLVKELFLLVDGAGTSEEEIPADVLLGALLGFRKTMLSYQTVCKTVIPQKQLLDKELTSKLFHTLVLMLDHKVHNVVTSSLEALQQLLKILRRNLVDWFRSPEISGLCIQKLGGLLLTSDSVRVSIRALALSCLTSVALYEPACLRGYVVSCSLELQEVLPRYRQHNDPMIRGNLYQLVGNTIKSSLEQEEFNFGNVPNLVQASQSEQQQAESAAAAGSPLNLGELCRILADAMLDPTATAARQACQGVHTCLHNLLLSNQGEYGLGLLTHLIARHTDSNRLVKIELLEIFGDLNYQLVAYLESTIPASKRTAVLRGCPVTAPQHPFQGHAELQQQIIQVVLLMLGSDDHRVREAASACLLKLVDRLFFAEDWGCTALTAMEDRHADSLLNQDAGLAMDATAAANDESTTEDSADMNAKVTSTSAGVLSRIVAMLVAQLHSSQSRNVLIGCYHALNVLTPSISGKAPVYVPDVIPLALDHLRVPWMALELPTHVNMLSVVGNLSRNAPAAHFRPYTGQLLNHVLRVLNICVHITKGTAPVPPSRSSSSRRQSTPNRRSTTPSGSPMRDMSSPAPSPSRSRTPSRGTPSRGSPAPTDLDGGADLGGVKAGSPRGAFSHLPHYMKLYETMKGSFEAEVVTLDTNKASSKFGDVVRASLEVLAVVVEHQGVAFQSYAEEALSYMTVVIVPEPRAVLLCVQQLLVVLFGKNNASSQPDDAADDTAGGAAANHAGNAYGVDKNSFFSRCIRPSRPSPDEKALTLAMLSSSQSSLGSDSEETRRRKSRASSDASGSSRTSGSAAEGGKQRSASSAKGQDEIDKPTMFAFIQMFEPLVIRAMNLYTTTSSIPLQRQILLLLCRLLTLRVNYNMLDGNLVFIKAVLKQLELIENGHIRNAHLLLSRLFQFLTLLIPEQSKLDGLLSMQRIIQLVDGLLASIHLPPRLFLPSLQPIVRELFIKSSSRQNLRPQKEVELSTLREVVINTLLKHLKHPPVWTQLDLLLTVSQDDEEKLKPLSRKIVDGLLPLLSSGEITIRNFKMYNSINSMLRHVAPVSLRPVVMLLKCLFKVALPHIHLNGAEVSAENGGANTPTKVSGGDSDAAADIDTSLSSDAAAGALASPGSLRTATLLVLLGCILRNTESSVLSAVTDFLVPGADSEPIAPEDALMQFIFQLLEHLAARFQAKQIITEFHCQEFAQLVKIMYSFSSDAEAYPRLYAACHREASTRGTHLNELIRRTIFIKPLLAVYWTQLLLVVKSEHGSWLEVSMLESRQGASITRGENVALHGAFVLSCENLVCTLEAATKPGSTGEKLPELMAALKDKPVAWYISIVGCSNEPTVLQLVTTVGLIGGDLAKIFYERVAAAMDASNFQNQLPPVQTKMLILFSKVRPSVDLIQLLIVQILPTPRLAVARRCEMLLSKMLDALSASTQPPSLASVVQLFDDCSAAVKVNVKARFPVLSASFERAGHTSIPTVASTQISSIEGLMAVPYEQWHQAYVIGVCGKSGRKGRSDQAACKLLENIGPAVADIVASSMFDMSLLPVCMRSNHTFDADHDASRYRNNNSQEASELVEGGASESDGSSTTKQLAPAGLAEVCRELVLNRLNRHWSSSNVCSGTRGTTVAESGIVTALKSEDGGEGTEATDENSNGDGALFALDDRAALCAGIALCFEEDSFLDADRASPLASAAPISEAAAKEAVHFVLTSLKVVSNAGYSVHADEIKAVLDCTSAVFGHPMVACILRGSSFASKFALSNEWLADVIANVATIYRAFAPPGSIVIPPEDTTDDREMGGPGSGGSSAAEGMGSVSFLPSLTFEQTQCLFLLVEELDVRLRANCVPSVVKGVAQPNLGGTEATFVAKRFRRVVVTIARLALPQLSLFGLIVNPDTGAVLRDGRGMLEELKGPPGELHEELLLDEPVLRSRVHRLKLLGYADNGQFDQLWSDMQQLLSPSELMNELVTTKEGVARVHRLAGRAMAASLMQVLMVPRAGDLFGGCRFHARVRDIPFLHTRAGKKLVRLRQQLEEAKGNVMDVGLSVGDPFETRPYCTNIERTDRTSSAAYGYGQLSVAMLHRFKIPQELEARSQKACTVSTVDAGFPAAKLHSSLEKLTTGMASTFADPGGTHPGLLADTVKNLLLLSDTFTCEALFEWAFTNLINIYIYAGSDDPVLFRSVVVGAAKLLALVSRNMQYKGKVHPQTGMVTKMVVEALGDQNISTQIAGLHGCIYLADAKTHDALHSILGPLAEYASVIVQNPTSVQGRLYTLCCSVSIILIEHFPTEMDEMKLVEAMVEGGIVALEDAATSDTVFHAVAEGLDRLLPSFTLRQGMRDRIEAAAHRVIKTMPALQKTTSNEPQRFTSALGLIITSMYTGPDGDRAGGLVVAKGGLASDAIETVSASCIGQISAIFYRSAVAGTCESRVLQHVLPVLLSDFLDPRQVMNIIVEEFTNLCTTEGASIELIARVVHQCFAIFQLEGRQGIATEWAILASSNFLQVTPRSRAISILACLFISVSQESVIRSLLDSVINHTASGLPMDPCLFWLPVMLFFLKENLSPDAKTMFLELFGSVPESPFEELKQMCIALEARLGEEIEIEMAAAKGEEVSSEA